MSKNVRNALLVLVAILVWLLSGLFFNTPEEQPDVAGDAYSDVTLVEVMDIRAQLYSPVMQFNAYTEAFRSVEVTAETSGALVATPAREGEVVEQGALLGVLNPEERELRVTQARAQLNQREIEYQAARELRSKNLLSSAEVAQAEAALESAKASLQAAELELRRSEIHAPFTGVFNQRYVDAGDFLQRGSAFGQMLQLDPLKVVFQVSEAEVLAIDPQQPVEFELSTGESFSGRFYYRSVKADSGNRAFRLEALIDNPERRLFADLSGTAHIHRKARMAHALPASALSLHADGTLFVKSVSVDNVVTSHEVSVIADQADVVWVTGLPENLRLIVTGHEYVGVGEQVDISLRDGPAAEMP